MSEEKRSLGRLARVGGAAPVVHVDCSHWARAEAASRSRGKMTSVGKAAGASGSGQPRPAWLELVVTFAAHVPPTEVWQQVNQLLRAMALAAPDMKLTYDSLRSRAENGDVVIALTPADAANAAGRLDVLTAALRAAQGKGVEIREIRVAA